VTSPDGSASAAVTLEGDIGTDEWHHVAMVYEASAGKMSLYIDGLFVNSGTGANTSLFDSTAEFQIGAGTNAGSAHWDGLMQDIMLHNAALTSQEVSELYNLYGNAKAEIYVGVPSVSSSVDTTMFVWYNTGTVDSQPAASAPFGAEAVYTDALNVFHLQEGANNVADNYVNSADGTKDGTGTSMSLSPVRGKWGGYAADLDGAADFIGFSSVAFTVSSNFTLQGWVLNSVFHDGGIVMNSVNDAGQYCRMQMESGATNNVCFRTEGSDSTANDNNCGATDTGADGKWHKVDAVWSSSAGLTVYLDGVSDGTDATINSVGTLSSIIRWAIGANDHQNVSAGNFYTGVLDECRIDK